MKGASQMGINAVSSFVAPVVAVAAKPVAVHEVANVSSVNSQSVINVRNDSAPVNSGNNDQDSNSNSNSKNTTSNTKQPSANELAKATDEINNFMESMNTNVQFVLHTRTNELLVQVRDSTTQRVLKECPAHELLDAVARMRDCVGVLLDKKA